MFDFAEALVEGMFLGRLFFPEWTQHMVSLHCDATWFKLEGASSFGSADAGSRPGHRFADFVFNFRLARVTSKVTDELKLRLAAVLGNL